MPTPDAPHALALTRREVLAGMAAAIPLSLFTTGSDAATSPLPASTYARMTVIDGECFFRENGKDVGNAIALSDSFVASVRASGLTAISATVGGSNVSGRTLRTMEETKAFIAGIDRIIAARPDVFLRLDKASDLAAVKRAGRLAILYNAQGTDELNGDPARISELAKLGIRVFQLTYNNAALAGDGCMEDRNAGLSRYGRDVIAAIEAEKCVLDLSHAGRRTTADAIAAATRPCVISHAGCNAINAHTRNVDDAEIRAVADKGGSFGIFFMPMLRRSGQCHSEDVIAHVEHALQVAGEEHVSIGTDGEIGPLKVDQAYRDQQQKVAEARVRAGVERTVREEPAYRYVPEYNVANRYQLLGEDLIRRGHSVARVEKILGANLARVLNEVLR